MSKFVRIQDQKEQLIILFWLLIHVNIDFGRGLTSFIRLLKYFVKKNIDFFRNWLNIDLFKHNLEKCKTFPLYISVPIVDTRLEVRRNRDNNDMNFFLTFYSALFSLDLSKS